MQSPRTSSVAWEMPRSRSAGSTEPSTAAACSAGACAWSETPSVAIRRGTQEAINDTRLFRRGMHPIH